jgi:nucleotide-binding universal stress UspA family protein
MPPMPYPHIACCVEDSDGSRAALEEAARLRRALGPGRLSVVHVHTPVPTDPYLDDGTALIAEEAEIESAVHHWLREEVEGLGLPDAEPVQLIGAHAASAVCEWAQEVGVDLLAAGSHRGFLQRLVVGSFASYLSHHSPCPVLLVRPPRERSGH